VCASSSRESARSGWAGADVMERERRWRAGAGQAGAVHPRSRSVDARGSPALDLDGGCCRWRITTSRHSTKGRLDRAPRRDDNYRRHSDLGDFHSAAREPRRTRLGAGSVQRGRRRAFTPVRRGAIGRPRDLQRSRPHRHSREGFRVPRRGIPCPRPHLGARVYKGSESLKRASFKDSDPLNTAACGPPPGLRRGVLALRARSRRIRSPCERWRSRGRPIAPRRTGVNARRRPR
jgi:hypothetical protein